MKLDAKNASVKSTNVNTTAIGKFEDIHGGRVPLDTLMLLEGSLDGKRVRVLNDDGRNTNVVSREFLKNNSELIEVAKKPVEVMHSQRRRKCNPRAESRIGTHVYTSIWVVASCRYDFLLGMPRLPPTTRRSSIQNELSRLTLNYTVQ